MLCQRKEFHLRKQGSDEGVGIRLAEAGDAEGSDLVAEADEVIAHREVFFWTV